MANVTDFSDALTQEGNLAKKYDQLAQEATKEENKKDCEELRDLSVKKMEILLKQLASNNWL